MKKVELKKIIKEVLKESSLEASNELNQILDRAIEKAEEFGRTSFSNMDDGGNTYSGEDPQALMHSIEDKLRKIYNAASTGNSEEDRSDEIFK